MPVMRRDGSEGDARKRVRGSFARFARDSPREKKRVEDRWERVRQIVREECERVEQRILAVLETNAKTARTGSVKFEMGKWVGITPAHLAAWQEAYPAVDVEQELRSMCAWLISNPEQSPRSQYGKFINTWLRSKRC